MNDTTNSINNQRLSMGKRNSDMEGLQTILETLGIIAILFIFFLYMMSLGSRNLNRNE